MILQLNLTPEQAQSLQTIAGQFNRELESMHFPTADTLHRLQTQLQEALLAQDGFAEFWEAAKVDHNLNSLCLVHERTAIRNLPWQLATEANAQLALSKSLSAMLASHQPSIGYPLKVLVMVAAPEGVTRLDYEREELLLLSAFSPLMSKGLVEVHFTDDGSLENLEEKLLENKYHILHYSGHGSYKDGEGSLALEDPVTGHLKEADAAAINAVLKKAHQKGHRPDLLVLSACQTAEGMETANMGGVANTLLQGGVPAVVAMSASILDNCATHFAAAFYEQLSQGFPLAAAFRTAIAALQDFEIKVFNPAQHGLAPGQWLIPQLLLCQEVGTLLDEKSPRTELNFSKEMAYVKGEQGLLELRVRPKGYVFVGRRKEKRSVFHLLKEGKAVLLRGQGGVGKTALAEHLAIRLLASNPRTKVFTHSEKTPAADSLLKQLQEYLTKDHRQFSVVTGLQERDTLEKKFLYLLECISAHCDPLFIFDNIESFQTYDAEQAAWLWNANQHEDVLTVLQILHQYTPFPVIVTGRYPLAEFADWTLCNLNTVPFGDFFKKCWQLPFSALADALEKEKLPAGTLKKTGEGKTSFEEVVKLLHQTLGGNYRALEFFDELYAREKDKIVALLDKLGELKDDPKLKDEVLHRMSENLIFEQLLSYLNAEDQDTLSLLARFRIPVLPMAIGMQRAAADRSKALAQLTNLTLVELQTGIDGRNRYYVTPLVGELLKRNDFIEVPFSATTAGAYHEYVYDEDLYLNWLSELSEAFEWYCEARDVAGVNRTGERLNRFYYDIQQFRVSLVYGLRTEEVAQEQTDGTIWNNLGLTLKLYGQLEPALHYYEKSLAYNKKRGNRHGEGAILNNISQIYAAKGDYDAALNYLKKTLEIDREFKDRQGEGITLNNISQIYKVRGDYDTALHYLQQSLKIRQDIGDRPGEGTTLNNISQIYAAKGDSDSALRYLEQSLKITQDIGDRKGEGTTLNNISQIYAAKGDSDSALHYLQQSLKIQQDIGDRQGEGTTLNNIAGIHKDRGNYETALSYYQQSLDIRQNIGDINGVAITLWNIGDVYMKQGDFEAAVAPIWQAYQIFERIGSPNKDVSWRYLEAIAGKIGVEKVQQIIQQMNQG
ncbi:MAG: tetratricopeptide repeat protein [Saprospiraceae bacterium]